MITLDKETEKVFIQDVKNRFNALSPCEISEKRFLNNCLLIIEQKEMVAHNVHMNFILLFLKK